MITSKVKVLSIMLAIAIVFFSNDFNLVKTIQNQILESYEQDFSKHIEKIDGCFNNVVGISLFDVDRMLKQFE